MYKRLCNLLRENKIKEFSELLGFARILKPDFDIDAYDENGFTLLHYAAMETNSDFFELLLNAGASVELPIRAPGLINVTGTLEFCIQDPYGYTADYMSEQEASKTKADDEKARLIFEYEYLDSKRLSELATSKRGAELLQCALRRPLPQVCNVLLKEYRWMINT